MQYGGRMSGGKQTERKPVIVKRSGPLPVVGISHDGRYVARGDGSGLFVIDWQTGQTRSIAAGEVELVEFSIDGAYLITENGVWAVPSLTHPAWAHDITSIQDRQECNNRMRGTVEWHIVHPRLHEAGR